MRRISLKIELYFLTKNFLRAPDLSFIMKKRVIVFMIVFLVLIFIVFVYQFKPEEIVERLESEATINSIISQLNENCPQSTFCVPFKPECGHWRVTSYAPYKYCGLGDVDKTQCQFIENDEWAAYCMALKASDEECLEFVGDDRKLQAVCHINDYGQFLFPRETFDREVYVSETNEIIENPEFSIWTNCSTTTANDCKNLLWEE